jgi:hypothetical protein
MALCTRVLATCSCFCSAHYDTLIPAAFTAMAAANSAAAGIDDSYRCSRLPT